MICLKKSPSDSVKVFLLQRYGQTDHQTGRQTNRPLDRHTHRQTDRQTDRPLAGDQTNNGKQSAEMFAKGEVKLRKGYICNYNKHALRSEL